MPANWKNGNGYYFKKILLKLRFLEMRERKGNTGQ
jgi:hypothetical protein